MGLGPPVCGDCMVYMRLTERGRGRWICPFCINSKNETSFGYLDDWLTADQRLRDNEELLKFIHGGYKDPIMRLRDAVEKK